MFIIKAQGLTRDQKKGNKDMEDRIEFIELKLENEKEKLIELVKRCTDRELIGLLTEILRTA